MRPLLPTRRSIVDIAHHAHHRHPGLILFVAKAFADRVLAAAIKVRHLLADDHDWRRIRFRNEIVTGVGGKQVLIEDPSGNPVELFEPIVPEARFDSRCSR